MNTKWTPGPWTAARMLVPPKAKDRRCGFVVNGPDDGRAPLPVRVCDMRVEQGFDAFAETEANARLIASAPDLAAALAELLRVTQDGAEPKTEHLRESYRQAFCDARAALVKAGVTT